MPPRLREVRGGEHRKSRLLTIPTFSACGTALAAGFTAGDGFKLVEETAASAAVP